MRRPRPAGRFAALAVIAALVASATATVPALAADPPGQDHEIRLADDTDRARADYRPYRSVTFSEVASLDGGSQSTDWPLLDRAAPVAAPRSPSPRVPASVPVLATTSTTPAPAQPTAFAGLANSSSSEPPDPWVAVGPDHVVQAVNTTIRITDRVGTRLGDAGMFQFFGLGVKKNPAGGPYQAEVSHPRVIFDSLQNRWLAIESSFDCYPRPAKPGDPHSIAALIGTGYIDVAISRTADPTGTWDVISLGYPDFVPDDPGLGTSTDKVVVSANVHALVDGGGAYGCHPATTLIGTELDVMAWAELKQGGLANIDYHFTDFAPGSSYPNNYVGWRPALQTPATSPTVFLVARQLDGGIAFATLTGLPATPGLAPLTITDLTAAEVASGFADPPQPRQPGPPATIANAVDGRPTDAIWQDNRLVFVSTYPCDPGGAVTPRACVRVTELETSGSPTRTQDFLIGSSGRDEYMGGVGFAGNGNLHVVWTRSSASAGEFPSTYTGVQLPTDPPNTLSAKRKIADGTGSYPGARWGEWVGVAQDPQVPNAVWQGHEYSAGAAGWRTKVSQLQTGGSSYVPITPLRVLDTRPAFQIGLSGVFAADVPRTFQLAGVGTIPADAIAVTGNVTVANQTAGGYVSVTPTAVANPISSTINFPLGDTRANNLTIPLATDGKLAAVYKGAAGKSTHLIVDITGYFLPGDEDATYSTVSPVRVLDTRPGFGIGLAGPFAPGVPRKLTIADTNGIPANAVAITGNLTVVGQTRAGYISITKVSDANPPTSNLNFPLGDTRANGVSVPLNASGALWIVYKAAGGSAHILLDVTGYYRNAPTGLLFYPLNPGRVMDTRAGVALSGLSGSFASSTPRRLDVAGHWGAPASAEAITGNLTVVNQTDDGYVSATLSSEVNPTTSVLNFPLGDTRANGVTLPLNTGGRSWLVFKASGGEATHLILDLSGYFD